MCLMDINTDNDGCFLFAFFALDRITKWNCLFLSLLVVSMYWWSSCCMSFMCVWVCLASGIARFDWSFTFFLFTTLLLLSVSACMSVCCGYETRCYRVSVSELKSIRWWIFQSWKIFVISMLHHYFHYLDFRYCLRMALWIMVVYLEMTQHTLTIVSLCFYFNTFTQK